MLNWLENSENEHIREGAVELQSQVHTKLLDQFTSPEAAQRFLMSGRTAWRRDALIKAQLVMHKEYSGQVLEIGAGSGWCSSLISTVPEVDRVYCLDYDPVSVQMLMPVVQKSIGANTAKIERVIGSYNSLPLENEIDFVVSIGALHHSEHLFATLSECFKVLKPGGWLFASEPVYFDSETNKEILARYKKEDPNSQSKYGKATKHEDNSDHYYRLCEYISACYAAKFDVYPFVFELNGSRHANDTTLRNRQTSDGFFTNVLYPYFAVNPANPMFDRLMLVLQKPNDPCDVGHRISS